MMDEIGETVLIRENGGLAAYLRRVWAVTEKDVRADLRTKESVGTMAVFALLAAVVFGLAFDLRVPRPQLVVPGILWVIILFTGVLGLQRSFGSEMEQGTLAGLLLAPVDRSALYFGKVAANLFYFLVVEALLLPTLLILFDVNLIRPLILLGLLLGTVGYTGVGTLFAALTAQIRTRETLLPVLLLPVLTPLFLAGVGLTAAILDARPLSDLWRWLLILGLYDALFLIIAFLLFDLIWVEPSNQMIQ